MSDVLVYWFAAHLFGDFLLQTKYMAAHKNQSTGVCGWHILTYMLPFLALSPAVGWHPVALYFIALEHFVQDRFSLQLAWMKYIKHTDPADWPAGPLFVDQSLHAAALTLISLTLS